MNRILNIWLLLGFSAFGTAGEAKLVNPAYDMSAAEIPWRTVNDSVMGGRSIGDFRTKGERIVFRGSTNTRGGGFSSIRAYPSGMDLTGSTGITLRLRGDGRTYTFRLEPRGTRASYWLRFATVAGQWMDVTLPYSDFWPNWRGRRLSGPIINGADIAGLGLMIYDGEDGPFQLELDRVTAITDQEAKTPSVSTAVRPTDSERPPG